MTDFGSDTSCTDELRPGRIVSGAELVAEAIYRRLTTPRGRLIDDASYGLDVRSLLGAGLTDTQLARIPGVVRGEVTKDPRVDACVVRATRTATGASSVALTLDVACETAAGPFRSVLIVTELTVEALR